MAATATIKNPGAEFGLTATEANRIVPLPEAAHLSSLSTDTLKREYPEYIIKLSERREGMRVHHALMIGVNKT
jgi:hypothetical protein